jgi:hypothetical protein
MVIKFNRLLAWLLVAMPWVHVAAGTPFLRGLAYDLGILAAHGLLSLALFGLPKARHDSELLWLALAPRGMTQRNVFLFTGWSIAAACLSMVITAALWWGTSATVFGALIIVLFAQAGLLWVPLPIRVIGHVYQAVEYAMARRRNTHSALRQNLAGLIAAAYVVGHAVNLLT